MKKIITIIAVVVLFLGVMTVGATGFTSYWNGKGALDDAESIVQKLTTEVSDLDTNVNRLKNKTNGLKAEKEALEEQLQIEISKNAELTEIITNLESQIADLDNEIKTLEETINTLLADKESLIQQLADAKGEIAHLTDEIAKANNDAATMISNVCTKVSELPFIYSQNFDTECGVERLVVTTLVELNEALANPEVDTIYVANGTYMFDAMEISNDVEIIGESEDGVIFLDNASEAVNMITVNTGYTVSISNLTIDGNNTSYAGIYSNGTLTVNNITVENIFQKTYLGFGIVSKGGQLIVRNSTFENIERVGVHANFEVQGKQHIIENNMFIGSGMTGNGVQYGVEVEREGNALIQNNEFHNFGEVADTDGSTSAGILATTYFQEIDPAQYGTMPTRVEIYNNVFNNSTYGIAIGYTENDYTVYTESGNVFNNVGQNWLLSK